MSVPEGMSVGSAFKVERIHYVIWWIGYWNAFVVKRDSRNCYKFEFRRKREETVLCRRVRSILMLFPTLDTDILLSALAADNAVANYCVDLQRVYMLRTTAAGHSD